MAKVVLLGTLVGVSIYVCVFLLAKGMYIPAAMPLIGAGLISYIFLSEKRYPLRWLVPGLLFLTVMVVYPIGYTFVSSFTNVGTGHMLGKEQALDQLLDRSYAPENAITYSFLAFANPAGDIALVLEGEGERILYTQGTASAIAVDDPRLVDEDGDGRPERFSNYARLSIPQLVPRLSDLEAYRIEYDNKIIGLQDLNEFRTRTPLYVYDAEAETMTDQQTGVVYAAMEGIFTSADGVEIYPGYKVSVGIRNYLALIRNPQISGPFAMVFGWTFAFATLTVLLNFALGLSTAILLNDPFLRFRTLYRVLMIIPYALPAFIMILVWRGMLNQHFGIINKMLVSAAHMIDYAVNYVAVNVFHTTAVLFGDVTKIPWLSNGMLAKASLLLLNLWLGYPYMMLICLGALQSIPASLYEAARVDGASWWQQFWKITLPLLLMPLAPLLIGAFAFNFNNFTLIWLLTEGRPAIAGATTPAGQTDILISYTYRLAFEGARGNQLGLAAAVSVMIFVVIATISAINFRLTGALEELSKNV
ncbi:maltose ABC transporter permease MalF [Candidatus Bipolaricaulota bacterium]|nr:maltose ABC transporter permease MalF [Candidatus Bipolaricaulota bacterium]